METSPLTKELYSIDWAKRFEQHQENEKFNYDDLNALLTKIEQTIEDGLKNKKGLDNLDTLKARLDNAKPESAEWHNLSMLINLKIINAAIPKGLTSTATLSAIQIMGHMWKTLSNASTTRTRSSAASATKEKSSAPQRKATRSQAKASNRSKSSDKNASQTAKDKKPGNVKSTDKPVAKQKEAAVTENVVIKNLASEAEADGETSLAVRCDEVANSLADEYPQYTLTAIRVMTAEKLGVTRQYVENLDIKPARFK